MKAIILTSTYTRFTRGFLSLIAVFGFLTLISSCDSGRNGRPGTAYLALEWEVDKPDYIDAGTPDIPEVFRWGDYYMSFPGFYFLYYEGEIWTGQQNAFYAWEIEYEIWEDDGEAGGRYYDGEDGYDSYFTLICSPYGPFVDEYLTKAAPATMDFEILSNDGDTIEILKKTEGFNMKVKYTRVIKRRSSAPVD